MQFEWFYLRHDGCIRRENSENFSVMASMLDLILRENDLTLESVEVRIEINEIESLPDNQRALKSFRLYTLKTRDRALNVLIEVTRDRIRDLHQQLQQQQQQQQNQQQ